MSDATFTVLQTGAVFHGRYRVVRCIRAGGMGAVYEVVDVNTESRRALKVMLPSTLEDPDLRSRFELEAKITGNLESDHIVKVSDAGIDAVTDVPFLVMELLRGEELSSILKRKKRLGPSEALALLYQAALGLDKTHAAGIVHRDLKPENMFVTRRDDGSACVKLLDFGIAKVVAQATTSGATRALGTPIFMAPEQIRGHGHITARADLYALGQITYALLTGETYWIEEKRATDSLYALFSVVLQGMKEPASERARRRLGLELPLGFDAWFRKATAVAPEDRFDRATEAIQVLREVYDIPHPRAEAAELMQVVPEPERHSFASIPEVSASMVVSEVAGPEGTPQSRGPGFPPDATEIAPPPQPTLFAPITGATRDAVVSDSFADPAATPARPSTWRLYAFAGGGALFAMVVGLFLFGSHPASETHSAGMGVASTSSAPVEALVVTASAPTSAPVATTEATATPSAEPSTAATPEPARPAPKSRSAPRAQPTSTSAATTRKHEGIY